MGGNKNKNGWTYKMNLGVRIYLIGMLVLAMLFAFSNYNYVQATEHETTQTNQKTYVEMNPIIVPIISDNGTAQIITIIVAIEVTGQDNETIVRENKLRLTDAFLTDMYGVLDKNRLIRNGYLDVERVKYRLNKITKKILGEETVSSVLLQAVQQRKV